ncbi:MAG: hypothetical protein JSW47_07420 [Phycisphaerales bacterium]|nr:MAG: hypothetical protein JSW47_07420 [Phycisphaerales bacterium]
MSEILPSDYGWLFIFQLIILLVAYIILRSRTELRLLMSICFSVLIVAGLTGLFLFINNRFVIIRMNIIDLKEYVTGTFIVAIPFILILIVQFLVPLLKKICKTPKAAGPERARILRMIEEGKITSEEGSDLLEAMGRSSAMQGQDTFSPLDMAMLAGVALVVLGFFLPWVHIRISGMSGMPGIRDVLNQDSMYQAGYHTGALGWMIFSIALISVIPVFITPKNLLYKISLFHLFVTLIGLLLVFITLLRAGSQLGTGIVTCAVGFTIELIASGAKFKSLAA